MNSYRQPFLLLYALGIALLLLPALSLAERVTLEIPSEKRSAEAEQAAISNAFSQLLERLAGGDRSLLTSALLKEIGGTDHYISSYYDRPVASSPDDSTGKAAPWVYVVEFETSELLQYFPGSGELESVDEQRETVDSRGGTDDEKDDTATALAITTPADAVGSSIDANAREGVLLWLLLEPLEGSTLIAGEEAAEPWGEEISQALASIPVAVELPLMDAQDLGQVNSKRIQEADDFSLLRASRRYPVTDVIAGVVSQDSTGAWFTRLHRLGELESETYGDADSLPSSLLGALQSMQLSADSSGRSLPLPAANNPLPRPGVEVSGAIGGAGGPEPAAGKIRVVVEGVAGYSDYRRVQKALREDTAVTSVQAVSSGAGQAAFDLAIKSGVEAWHLRITQNPDSVLQPISEPVSAELSHSQYLFRLK
ncbi:MAG: DUF2066 domain-containing protein [bacterium]